MDFTIRKHSKEKFYPTYKKWLLEHNFPIIDMEFLPQLMFVCYLGQVPIYAAPFFHTDSKVAMTAFIASNKSVNYDSRIGGIISLFLHIAKYAKNKKYLSVYSPTTSEPIIKAMLNVGFTKGDNDSSQYFLKLY